MGAQFVPETGEFRNLMARVRAQDPEAARELVRCYESAIRRVIRIQMRDTRLRQILDSTDVCQSVLATFFVRTALGQYDLESPAQLVSLLTTIARNKLVNQFDHMRAQRRDVGRNQSADTPGIALLDRASDPAEQRSIGRAWIELSVELGKTDVALRKQLFRALDRVMTELGVDEPCDA